MSVGRSFEIFHHPDRYYGYPVGETSEREESMNTVKLRIATFSLAAVIGLMSIALAHGQEKSGRLTFDVAAIRASQPGVRGGVIKPLPGGDGYLVQNMSVKIMISLMYKVPTRQITGGPDWLDTDRYDLQAKADHSYSIDDLHLMFQNLLADRFSLKFHKETKEGPVYALMVDKPGSKMKINESDQDFKIPITPATDGVFVGRRVPMQYLCWFLGQQLQTEERPVIDRTGLGKNYDFTLSFAPELPPNFPKENLPPGLLDRPSIFDALKEQLGLRLQAQKGPVEYYVIDHLEKPSAN
jgi:uncharacterized protein (TIGR03435 family)